MSFNLTFLSSNLGILARIIVRGDDVVDAIVIVVIVAVGVDGVGIGVEIK